MQVEVPVQERSLQPLAQRKIRLLVLDIDGTLAGPSNQVSEPVRQAIQGPKPQACGWPLPPVGCIVLPSDFTMRLEPICRSAATRGHSFAIPIAKRR